MPTRATLKPCRMCRERIPRHARVCSHCGTFQKAPYLRYLGASVPLVAATASTLLLLWAFVADRYLPERAQVLVRAPAPAYSRDALAFDIANLSDVTVLLPAEVYCVLRGDMRRIERIAPAVTQGAGGDTYAVFTFQRTGDAAPGLRNAAARVTYAAVRKDWAPANGDSARGVLECSIALTDRHDDLPVVIHPVAFETHAGALLFFNLDEFPETPAEGDVAGLFFGVRDALLAATPEPGSTN